MSNKMKSFLLVLLCLCVGEGIVPMFRREWCLCTAGNARVPLVGEGRAEKIELFNQSATCGKKELIITWKGKRWCYDIKSKRGEILVKTLSGGGHLEQEGKGYKLVRNGFHLASFGGKKEEIQDSSHIEKVNGKDAIVKKGQHVEHLPGGNDLIVTEGGNLCGNVGFFDNTQCTYNSVINIGGGSVDNSQEAKNDKSNTIDNLIDMLPLVVGTAGGCLIVIVALYLTIKYCKCKKKRTNPEPAEPEEHEMRDLRRRLEPRPPYQRQMGVEFEINEALEFMGVEGSESPDSGCQSDEEGFRVGV
uniref:Putative structural protein n=1 Tax=Piscine myocarditis virus TaxID=1271477 RepID=L0E399_9VIRU|nr:putative structural protein [Piscine myocarditis virus]